MGAWGTDTFDNDTAGDWGYDLEEHADLSLVRSTIEQALSVGSEYLDSDLGCTSLAACEVLARLQGNFGAQSAYTEAVDQWVRSHPMSVPSELVVLAVRVIDRVLTTPSELLELWEEAGDEDEWRARVGNLRERVAGPPSP